MATETDRLAALELQLAALLEANAELKSSLNWANEQLGKKSHLKRTRTPLEVYVSERETVLANGKPNTNKLLERPIAQLDKMIRMALREPSREYEQSGYSGIVLGDWLKACHATLEDWLELIDPDSNADAPSA